MIYLAPRIIKWVAYGTLICSVLDILGMELARRDGADIMFPGMVIIILAPVILYSLINIIIAHATRWADRWPVLMFFWLSPGCVFVSLHAFMIFVQVFFIIFWLCAGLLSLIGQGFQWIVGLF